jgi:hypothetical protein
MFSPRPILAGAVLAVCASPAFAAMSLATAPLPVVPGQQLTLCAVNVGRHKTKVTLKFINVHTGAIAAQKDLILSAAGSQNPSPEPCLSTTSDALTGSAGNTQQPPLVVAVVAFRWGIFEQNPVTASLQIGTPGSKQPYTIPLGPARIPFRRGEVIAAPYPVN